MKKKLINGITLSYKISDLKNQSFILIHNAGGNHQFMEHQFHYFNQQGTVLSLDLRGHGESDKPEQVYTVEGYAEDIAILSQKAGLSGSIVIGLNYGAAVAIELATTYSKLASCLVLIDPPILMEGWVKELVQNHINELKDSSPPNFSEHLVENVLLNTSGKNKKMAIEAFDTTARQALLSTYENLMIWDKKSSDKIRHCNLPILHIQSSRPFCNETLLQNACPHAITGKVVGSGPWATLEVPDQVNLMIDRFNMLR